MRLILPQKKKPVLSTDTPKTLEYWTKKVIDLFGGRVMGTHKQGCQDLACPGCYIPQAQRPKAEQGRLF